MNTAARTVMRAIRVSKFGGPQVLKLEENMPLPSVGENQVLILNKAVGVNPVETYIREGVHTRIPTLPYIPGIDSAGTVEQTGCGVVQFKKGDRVFCTAVGGSGAYAQYVAADSMHVFPLEDKLSFSQGAAIGVPYFTAYRALILKARTKPGEVVLIHGASGGVGTAVIQMARAYGMTVVGTAGTSEGMDIVKGCGAHHVFNHREKGYQKKMMAAVGEMGFDVILETTANINLSHDLELLNKRGRIVVIGCRGQVEINPRLLMGPETSIIGCAVLTTSPDEWKEIGSAIVSGIKVGWVNPVVDHEYKIEDVQQAHHDIIHSKGAKGKLVLKVE